MKKITSVLKRHLLKNNSANYFELTEKIKFIQDDLNLTEQQQMLEINELIFTLSQEVQVTGLSFSASYKNEALMITLIFMLVVTSLVASTSNT